MAWADSTDEGWIDGWIDGKDYWARRDSQVRGSLALALALFPLLALALALVPLPCCGSLRVRGIP